MDESTAMSSPINGGDDKSQLSSNATTHIRCPESIQNVKASNVSSQSRVKEMACEIGYFLTSYLQPSCWTDWIRHQVYHFVESCIWECGEGIGLHGQNMKIHLFGSFSLSTYLPEGDIDITVQCPEKLISSLMHRVYKRFVSIDVPVQFVQADVKLIKCYINDICVDISFNQLIGLSTALFVTEVNTIIPKDLFKRSLILLKAWAYYESRILGAHGGLLGSYALTIMLIPVCNRMHFESKLSTVTTELDVLLYFFEFYTKYDIRHNAITIYGVKRYSRHEDLSDREIEMPSDSGCIIDREFMRMFRSQNRIFLEQLGLEDGMIPSYFLDSDLDDPPYSIQAHRHVNVVDPLRANNNLARGVHLCHATRIQVSIERAAQELHALLHDSQTNFPWQSLSSRMAMVSHCNLPTLVNMNHGYPHFKKPILQSSILSFFENSFRKVVLPKLLQKRVNNRSCSDFDKFLRFGVNVNKPKYRNPFPDHSTLPFENQDFHGMVFKPRQKFQAQWGSFRKTKQNNLRIGDCASPPTFEMWTPTPRHLSPAPDGIYKNVPGNRKLRTTPQPFLNPKKVKKELSRASNNDRRSYRAGDLIGTIGTKPMETILQKSRVPVQRRSSSVQSLISPRDVHDLPSQTRNWHCGGTNSSTQYSQHVQQTSIPKDMQQIHVNSRTVAGGIDALLPVQLPQHHELSYYPVSRSQGHPTSYFSQFHAAPRLPHESFPRHPYLQKASAVRNGSSINRQTLFCPRAAATELNNQLNVAKPNNVKHSDVGHGKRSSLGQCSIALNKKEGFALQENACLSETATQSLSSNDPSDQQVTKPSGKYIPPCRRQG